MKTETNSNFQTKDSNAFECKHCGEEFRRKNKFHAGNGFIRDVGEWMRKHECDYTKTKPAKSLNQVEAAFHKWFQDMFGEPFNPSSDDDHLFAEAFGAGVKAERERLLKIFRELGEEDFNYCHTKFSGYYNGRTDGARRLLQRVEKLQQETD